MLRTYNELMELETFEDRYHYLSLNGRVGEATFGFERWLNQQFYSSRQWRDLRHHIAVRDQGCDLAVPDREIHGRPIVHHMNPMRVRDLIEQVEDALNPEFLILTTHRTHNAIHYGDESLLPKPPIVRRAGDTQLWSRRS